MDRNNRLFTLFMLRKSNFLIISQSIVLSFDLIVLSIFLMFLSKLFLSRMRLCMALFLNFFFRHKVSYPSIFRMLTYINLGKSPNVLQLIKKFMSSCDLFRLICSFSNLRKSLTSLNLSAIACIIHPEPLDSTNITSISKNNTTNLNLKDMFRKTIHIIS